MKSPRLRITLTPSQSLIVRALHKSPIMLTGGTFSYSYSLGSDRAWLAFRATPGALKALTTVLEAGVLLGYSVPSINAIQRKVDEALLKAEAA